MLLKKTSMLNLANKGMDISCATTRVTPDLLKSLAVPSEATVRKSAIDREDLKPY